MTSHISKIITQSEIRNMSVECEKIGGINLSQGICDFPINQFLKSGAIDAMDSGLNHYTKYDGLDELKKSISKKVINFNKIPLSSDEQILITSGATAAFYSACLALLNPGDEVIMFQPFYGYHRSTLLSANLKPIFVNLFAPDWNFDIFQLKKLVTPKTKAILICSPSNPCGKIFTLQELNILADFAIENNLIIFTDEIYEYFTYDDNVHVSPGSLKKIEDRTITISGFSKTLSITGWRIGYLVCKNEEWLRTIGYVHDLIYVCAPAPLQIGVARALNSLDDNYYRNLCLIYSNKREIICNALSKAGLIPLIPEGSYYVLFDSKRLPGTCSKEKAMNLLVRTNIATVPGNEFYDDSLGDDLLRLCFAKEDDILLQASELLQNYKDI